MARSLSAAFFLLITNCGDSKQDVDHLVRRDYPSTTPRSERYPSCGAALLLGLAGLAAVVVITVIQHDELVGEMVRESFAAALDRARYEDPLDSLVLRLAVLQLDEDRDEVDLKEIAAGIDSVTADRAVSHAEALDLLRRIENDR